MELKHIAIEQLSVSRANMRGGRKGADIAGILPSVRARGVLVPLIVRANGSPDAYEIVAGRRRFEAACAVATEAGEIDPLPCAVIAAGDDAAALEASLIENIARLDPDEVTQWATFTRLIRKGRSAGDIALTFGLTDLQVRRTLALGNLLPRIRSLYRRGEIDAATIRHLTLATKAQQRDWLALLDDPNAYCPTGQSLKAWLFGGDTIPVSVALFDLSSFDGEIVSDLFGDERYFASSEAFWVAQQSAIDAKVGEQLAVDMAAVWQPDAAFLDGLRDREVLLAMVREVGGDVVADGNADAKAKVLRGILTDHIEGSNGREKVEGWVPGWMAFPASTYTDRGGVGSVMRTAHVATMTTPAAANDDTEIVQPEAAS